MNKKVTYEELAKKDRIYTHILPTKIVSPVDTPMFWAAYILSHKPDYLTPKSVIDLMMNITNSYVFVKSIQVVAFMQDIGLITAIKRDRFMLSEYTVENLSPLDVSVEDNGIWDETNYAYMVKREQKKTKEFLSEYSGNEIVTVFKPFLEYKKDEIIENIKHKRHCTIDSADWLTALQNHFEITDEIIKLFRDGIKWHNDRAEKIKKEQQ